MCQPTRWTKHAQPARALLGLVVAPREEVPARRECEGVVLARRERHALLARRQHVARVGAVRRRPAELAVHVVAKRADGARLQPELRAS